ncbi:site-specific integrase [Marinomonas sp. TW1]|uniref:site-specific integrase n=1 Tax=Marinomonas sp. TW1 TaxID=1561203 RepID=UPI0007AF29AB|nr:site-specific integrase [Marinomonas sp. TW1]
MATFKTRTKKNGSIVHVAQIRISRGGKVVFSEASSFEGKSASKNAKLWAANREAEVKRKLESGKSLVQLSVAEGMARYVSEHEDAPSPLGKTKRSTMMLMSKEPLLKEVFLSEMTSADLMAYLRKRYHEDGAKPATVNQDISYIRVLAKYARVAWSVAIDLQEIDDALELGNRMGIIDRSTARARRPSLDELIGICDYVHRERNGKSRSSVFKTPLADVVLFAIFSTRRLGEICRIEWNDIDFAEGVVLIKDMKHPRKKKGNDMLLHLPNRAIEIIKRQPRQDGEPRVFPYAESTIGSGFRRSCVAANIEDLTFHDLRHEGVSHLFELGYAIPQVSMVSGHRSWNNLARYTHLNKVGAFDKYADFEPARNLGEAGLIKPI